MTAEVFQWIGSSMADLTFSEAHWIFAFYFLKIAKNIPLVIEDSQSSHASSEKPKDFTKLYWIGITANAIFPLGELVGGICYSVAYYNSVIEPVVP